MLLKVESVPLDYVKLNFIFHFFSYIRVYYSFLICLILDVFTAFEI